MGAKSVFLVHSHSLQRWSPSISSLQVQTDGLTHLLTITRLNLFLLHLNLGWLFDLFWPKKCGSSDAVLILGLAFKSLAASAFPLEASFHKRSAGNPDTLRPPCWAGHERRPNWVTMKFQVCERHLGASSPVQLNEWPQVMPQKSRRTAQLIPLTPQNHGK